MKNEAPMVLLFQICVLFFYKYTAVNVCDYWITGSSSLAVSNAILHENTGSPETEANV